MVPVVCPAVSQNAPRIRSSILAALSEEDISLALEVTERHKGLLAGGGAAPSREHTASRNSHPNEPVA